MSMMIIACLASTLSAFGIVWAVFGTTLWHRRLILPILCGAITTLIYAAIGTPDADAALERRIEALQTDIKADPANLSATLNIARSLMQLKRFEDAQAAYLQALEASNNQVPGVYREYVGAMQFAGIEVTPQNSQQYILGLPADEQAIAIRGMVAGLAARLEEAGGSRTDWEMLARSYETLGETDKARYAREQAALITE